MVFSSVEFIFRFFIIFIIAYIATPTKYRNVILLMASLVFYAFGEPKCIVIMLFSIIVNYWIGIFIEKGARAKAWLITAIAFNISLLFIFKYINFIINIINAIAKNRILTEVEVMIPIGISFYTFQIISYVVDIYKKKISAEHNILSFATYISMFPKVLSGPIVYYRDIKDDIKERVVRKKDIEAGCVAFTIGLIYKVLLANQMGTLWNSIQTVGVYGINAPVAWLGAWGFSFQLYFDFAGYSLMAIGLGRMLGFFLPINFVDPYTSKSVTEFWRRWHITLSGWFRDYVYIPLGGNRGGVSRTILNLLIVWILTGLWHGASWNFVIWGIMFFILITIEKMFIYKYLDGSKVIGHLYMLIIIPTTWVVFAVTDIKQAVLYLQRMFFIPIKNTVPLDGVAIVEKYFGSYWWLILICIICATPIPMKIIDKYYDKIVTKVVLMLLFWLCLYNILSSGNNPFLYFNY